MVDSAKLGLLVYVTLLNKNTQKAHWKMAQQLHSNTFSCFIYTTDLLIYVFLPPLLE